MNRCGVCADARAEAVNAVIASGRPLRRVADDFALSYDALKRHVRNGHVAPASGGSPLPSPTPRGNDSLANLRADLAIVNAMDPTSMSPSAAMALMAERRRLNEVISRLDPPIIESPESPTIAEFLRIAMELGSAYPEFNSRLVEAWKRYKGGT
jgi:hypothetical protein